MSRFVQFDRFGGPEVLTLRERAVPEPGAGEVRIRVATAGLNPVDYKIVAYEALAAAYGTQLPSGVGNDFAGTVEALGEGVTEWGVGDRVYGGHRNGALADHLVIPAATLHRVPDALDLTTAATLDVAGATAAATVRYIAAQPGETVLVSAAAGGVGLLAAQLLVRDGVRVLGTASAHNHAFLRDLGIEPIAYGDGLVDRIRDAAPEGLDAVLDNNGAPTLAAAAELGVNPARVNTIVGQAPDVGVLVAEHGYSVLGGADADPAEWAIVAERVAAGEIVVPIAGRYALEDARAAYTELAGGHVRGKLVFEIVPAS